MTIDTARLATDAEYWDFVAPDGAELFTPESEGRIAAFWKKDIHQWKLATERTDWELRFGISLPDQSIAIPRPQSEWVEYPSGTGKLIVSEPDNNGVVIVLDDAGEYRRVAKGNIKPARAKAQRDRDELALSLQNAIEAVTGNAFDDADALVVANDLLAKGWTKS